MHSFIQNLRQSRQDRIPSAVVTAYDVPIKWTKCLRSLLLSDGSFSVEEAKAADQDALAPIHLKPDAFVQRIHSLYLDECALKDIPALPPNLLNLSLHGNWFETLPESEQFWPLTLETIDVADNQLETLPECFSKLVSLETLHCQRNVLARLPEMQFLKELWCQQNRLKRLPNCLMQVTDLDCSRNQIQHLPKLPRVENLWLHGNPIRVIPPHHINKSILRLQCSQTNIISLPSAFQNLTDLDISSTRIASLPTNLLLNRGNQCCVLSWDCPALYIPKNLRRNLNLFSLGQPINNTRRVESIIARFQRRVIKRLISKRLGGLQQYLPLPLVRIVTSYVPVGRMLGKRRRDISQKKSDISDNPNKRPKLLHVTLRSKKQERKKESWQAYWL